MKNLFIAFMLIIASYSCKSKAKAICNNGNFQKLFMLDSMATLVIPQKLGAISDTVKHEFEPDNELLYSNKLFATDSASWLLVTALKNDIPNNQFVMYADEVRKNRYNFFQKMSNISEEYLKIDTMKNRIYMFAFPFEKEGQKFSFGGILFYVNDIKFELYLQLDNRNFDSCYMKMKCILNSLEIRQ